MKTHSLFGIYLYNKRLEKGFTLRKLASRVGISHTYLYNIEVGLKDPPNDFVLIRIADVLMLDDKSRRILFDMAVSSMKIKDNYNYYVPVDVLRYLSYTQTACEVIRTVENLGYDEKFWSEFLIKLQKYVP